MKYSLLPLLGIAIFMASLPLNMSFNTNCMIIMLVLMIVAVFLPTKDWKSRFAINLKQGWRSVFFVLFAFYLLHITGLLWANNVYAGVRKLDSTGIPYMLFPVLLSATAFESRQVNLLLRYFVWVVIAFCSFGLLTYALIMPGFSKELIANAKPYAHILLMWPAHWHPTVVAILLLPSIPIVLSLKREPQMKQWFRIAEVALGLALPVIYATLLGARAAILAIPVLLGLAFLYCCKIKQFYKWMLIGIVMVATIFILPKQPKLVHAFFDQIRVELWTNAVDAIKEKPLLGWGTGASKALIQSPERAERLGIKAYSFNQFHNEYLEDAVEFGVLGIIVLALLIGWPLWIGIKKKDYLLVSIMALYMVHWLSETSLCFFKGAVSFSFWLCFLLVTQKARLENGVFVNSVQ